MDSKSKKLMLEKRRRIEHEELRKRLLEETGQDVGSLKEFRKRKQTRKTRLKPTYGNFPDTPDYEPAEMYSFPALQFENSFSLNKLTAETAVPHAVEETSVGIYGITRKGLGATLAETFNSCTLGLENDVQVESHADGTERSQEASIAVLQLTNQIMPSTSFQPKSELLQFLMKFQLKHKARDEAILDIIDLLKLVTATKLPVYSALLPKTAVDYNTQCGVFMDIPIKVHWECRKCKIRHETAAEKSLNSITCCGEKAKYVDPHFFTLSLRHLLSILLPKLFPFITERDMQPEGINNLRESLGFGGDDIFLISNTDGVSISNRSNKSIWPILISVYGTPQNLRNSVQNMLLQCLWIGVKTQPDMNWLCEELVLQLKDLIVNPLEWIDIDGNTRCSRVYLLYMCADSMARCKVAGISQHNAKHGCTYCVHDKIGRHYKCIPFEYRSKDNYEADAAETNRKTKIWGENGRIPKEKPSPRNGVYKRTVFLDLDYIDPVWFLPVDWMHAGSEGVIKQLVLAIYLPPKTKKLNHSALTVKVTKGRKTQPYSRVMQSEPLDTVKKTLYLGKQKRMEMDAYLRAIKPPKEFPNGPRLSDEFMQLKASELFALGVFYLPVKLKQDLPPEIWLVYSYFLQATELLCSRGCSTTEVDEIERKMNLFSKGVDELFPEKFATYNVHLMRHLAECYRRYGPMFLYSLRYFESYNGTLIRYARKNQFDALTICKCYVKSVACLSLMKEDPKSFVTAVFNGIEYFLYNKITRNDEWTSYRKIKYTTNLGTTKLLSSENQRSSRYNSSCFYTEEGKVIELLQIRLSHETNKISLVCDFHHLTKWDPNLLYVGVSRCVQKHVSINPIQRGFLALKIEHDGQTFFLRVFNSTDLNCE